MKNTKIFSRLLLLLAAILCGGTAMAQASHIGNGQQGASVVDSIRYNPSDGAYHMYVRACQYYFWGYGMDRKNYQRDTVVSSRYSNDDFTRDSLVTLHLSVYQLSNVVYNPVPACDSVVFRDTTVYSAYSGNYSLALKEGIYNSNGCDSVYIVNLQISGRSTERHFPVTRCDEFTWPINNLRYTCTSHDSITIMNEAGCDSLMVLDLTINNSTTSSDTQDVCDSYTWQGSTYTTTGNRTKVLRTVFNCDSTVTLHLTVRHSTSKTFPVDVCDRYTWQGTEYTASGTHYDTIPNAAGCDSCMTLKLTIRHGTHDVFSQQACDSYTWDNHGASFTRTASDVVVHNYTNSQNCPSADTLHLTVNHSTTVTDEQSECDSYTWEGQTYTASATDTRSLHTIHGCDSLVTLDLTIRHSSSTVDSQYACYAFDWHGHHYTSSNFTDQWVGTNAENCDSVVTLNLTIRPYNTDTTNVVVCDSYTWNGTTFTSSVTGETRTLTNHFGCDSVDVLNLTVNRSTSGSDVQTACDSYTWQVQDADGSNRHVAGIYTASTATATATVTNAAGCDSVVTLNLTVSQSSTGTFVHEACDSYTWKVADFDGTNVRTVGTYTASNHTATATVTNAAGCDSVVALDLTIHHRNLTGSDEADVCDSYTWNGTTYTASGIYTNNTLHTVHGCDSAARLTLTVRHSTTATDQQSHCDSYTWINGTTYTASTGTPTFTLTNSQNCDSNITLALTIRRSSDSTITVHGCDAYTWNSIQFTRDTVVSKHFTNIAGCDSLAHLHLTMDASIHVTEVVDSCRQCTWHGQTYTHTSPAAATYQALSAAGCDSIVTLDLTIHNDTLINIADTACDSYTWVAGTGSTYTYSQTPAHTFTDRWQCDSTIVLHLTIHHSDNHTVYNEDVCDSYTWPTNGVTYTSGVTGVKDTLQTQHGCDSVVTLNLVVRHSTASIDVHDECDSYTWMDGHTYTASTSTPTYTVDNAAGCDSVVTLHLTVRHSTTSTDVHNVCDSYTWLDGHTYTASTSTPTHTITNAAGCDSLITLHLTVRHRFDSILVMDVCDSYRWHGSTYTASTNTPRFDTVNAAGCDSTVYLHLTVRHSTTATDPHDACDSYTWHGTTYTASTNTPTHTETNSVGCDSTTTLHLTIRHSTSRTDVDNACDSYIWVDGNTYTASNNTASWQVPGGNTAGCDSVAYLNLTMHYSTSREVRDTACDSYTFRDSTYTVSTIYPTTITNVAGCDSLITLYLTMDYSRVFNDVHDTCDSYTWTDGITYTATTSTPVQSHLHTVVGGCDSTSHLHLTIRYSSAYTQVESACDSFLWVNNGRTYYTSNNSDTVHMPNASACDSLITLNLTVRNSSHVTDTQNVCDSLLWHGNTYCSNTTSVWWNGTNLDDCDSIVTLNLTVRHRTAGVDVQDICDSITWLDGITYTADNNTAQTVITNLAGCDSVVTLNLNVRHSSNAGYNVTECDRYVWPRNNTTYDHSQTAYYNYYSSENCPSVDTLRLTINNSSHLVFNETVCDTFRWQCHDTDTLIGQSGTYSHTYINDANCASADTLHLNINYNTSTAFHVDSCDRYRWVNHGLDTLITTSGTYLHTYNTSAGCPSTDTLYATIRYSSHQAFDTTVCDSYHWDCHNHHQDYTLTGTWHHEYENAAGCPSADTLHLTVNHNTSAGYSQTACDTYTWDNHGASLAYDTTGTYTHDYLTAENCPSTDTLRLTVNYNTSTAFPVSACDAYTWNNNDSTKTYIVGGTFYNDYISYNGCPSVDTLYLTLHYNSNTAYTASACDSFVWTNNGFDTLLAATGTYLHNYTNADNCASTDTLHLTMRFNSDSVYLVQACDRYVWPVNNVTYTSSAIQAVNYTNAEGCASTDSLYLTVHYNTHTGYADTACDRYVWTLNGDTAYNQTGTYYRHYMNADSVCLNVDTLRLVVYHNTSTAFVNQACDTFRWENHGWDSTYYASGIQLHNYLTGEGCLSTDTLYLTVNYNTNAAIDTSVCDYFVWDNHGATLNYDTTGTYTHDYLTAQNCPSTDTLHLDVRYNTNSAFDTAVCNLFAWVEFDTTLIYTVSGTYFHQYFNAVNCPSTDTLRLTVHHSSDTLYEVPHACDSYVWERDTIQFSYDTSGTYTHHYWNQWGCESVDTLRLTVYYNTDTVYVDTACDQYTWRPLHDPAHWTAVYASDTVATRTYTNDVGCVSHDTLYLTVYPSPRGVETYTACDSFLWRDSVIYFGSTSTAVDTVPSPVWCDSIITLHLTVNYRFEIDSIDYFCDSSNYTFHDSIIYTPGIYDYQGQTSKGCDSVIHLELVQLPKPQFVIEESYSCETYEYSLTLQNQGAVFDIPYRYTWESSPEDATLLGQEHGTSIVVHPVKNTLYEVLVEYDGIDLPLCASIISTDTLVPIVQPHSAIKTTPPYVESGDIRFTVEDKSTGYSSRAWYVNGEYWGDQESFDYSAPANGADSVALMLISASETCADTAYLLVPIYNFSLYIPNIFTPAEQTNNVFKVSCKSIHDFEMWIYTREGLLVYHTADINEGWDGRHKGELCRQAAYVYHIRYNYVVNPNAWHTATGTVMLIR